MQTMQERIKVVVPSQESGDEVLARSIVAAFERNPLIDTDKIQISVTDGVVSVDGMVSNYPTIRKILSIIERTPGVIGVHNNLLMEHQPI